LDKRKTISVFSTIIKGQNKRIYHQPLNHEVQESRHKDKIAVTSGKGVRSKVADLLSAVAVGALSASAAQSTNFRRFSLLH
jgi:hypothetical protein